MRALLGPDVPRLGLVKEIASMWKAMDEEGKARWRKEAGEDDDGGGRVVSVLAAATASGTDDEAADGGQPLGLLGGVPSMHLPPVATLAAALLGEEAGAG